MIISAIGVNGVMRTMLGCRDKYPRALANQLIRETQCTKIKQAAETSFATMQNIMEMPGTPKERLDFLITKMLEFRRERIEFSQLISKTFESDTTPDEQKSRMALRQPLQLEKYFPNSEIIKRGCKRNPF